MTDSDSQYMEGFDEDDDTIKSQVIPAFLSKTYAIMHNEDFKDIVCWGENGESIMILKVDDFSQKVLPLYFKHGNFSSFVRQLNMYGFHKTRQDPNWREFRHPMFKRGHLELLPLIKRKNCTTKTKGERREHQPDQSDRMISLNVKRNKVDRDTLLWEFTQLKKQTTELEAKYTNVLQENRLLWQTFMKSKQQQDVMKQQMERICRFLYKMYPGNHLRDANPSSIPTATSEEINPYMITDRPAVRDGPFSMSSTDYAMMASGEEGMLTANQYNNTLDYLQMNSVPRADSPRTMPLRTPLEDSRMQYTTPMLMNEAANADHSYFPNSTLRSVPSFSLPSSSSIGAGLTITDLDDLQAIDIQGSTASLDLHPTSSTTITSTTTTTTTTTLLGENGLKGVGDKNGMKETVPGTSRGGDSSMGDISISNILMNEGPIQKAPSSPIPLLDLGKPYIRDSTSPSNPTHNPNSTTPSTTMRENKYTDQITPMDSEVIVLDTSQPTSHPLPLPSTSSSSSSSTTMIPTPTTVPLQGALSDIAVPGLSLTNSLNHADSFSILKLPSLGSLSSGDSGALPSDPSGILSAFQDDVKRVDAAGASLSRRMSQMETGLSSPFLLPNIETMERQGMF